MKRALASSLFVVALAVIAVGLHASAAEAKLPKCSEVKCRDIGCPADVLCVSGGKVVSCAQACGGR